ncbi:UNVERIFIED_CONTAM: hypothetical protein FKN15_001411 [Acipenser sinensis]
MLDGFLMYLLSKEGDVFNPAHATVYQDMSQPLSHYFISSSHNTYLLQDQLGGPSSTEAYLSVRFHGFDHASQQPANEMSSFSEGKARRLIRDSGNLSPAAAQAESGAAELHRGPAGFNPRWNHTLVFDVGVPELALVRFVVEDHDTTSSNDFVGQFTLPFTSLRQGYRHIHLLSADGAPISPASLFVHIKVSELSRSQSV